MIYVLRLLLMFAIGANCYACIHYLAEGKVTASVLHLFAAIIWAVVLARQD